LKQKIQKLKISPKSTSLEKLMKFASSKCFVDTTTVPINAHLPCYQVSYGIAQNKKPHMIAETVVLPSATDTIPAIFGAKCAQQLCNILLSDITVCLCIADTHIYQKSWKNS
jgi:hypothetical protein